MNRKTVDDKPTDGKINAMSNVCAGNLVSVSQAANMLGISYVQVGNHIRANRIRAMKVGRSYVIDKDSLDEFAIHRRKPGNPNFSKKSS